jgi:hypothetical protein
MDNKKVASLLNKGMKFDSLKMLNETQIDTLYNAIIVEQDAGDAADEVKSKVQDAINMTDQLRKALVGEEDLEENEDGLEDLSRQDYTGQEGPHDETDMAPDGMDDDSDNNRSEMGEEEIKEKFRSKAQQGYFFAKCEEEGPKSKWCKMADEFADDTEDFSKLPEKVETNEGTKCWKGYEKKGMKTMFGKRVPNCVKKESKEETIRQIEESLVSLVKKYVSETMTKKDLMNLLEQPGTKEAPVKTPTRTKPERKTPYQPKHKPAPKAADTEVAPSRVKPGTKEKPGRKTPYQPKHKPAPKAGKKGLPEFLKFNTLNIQFRDEQED